MKLHPLMRAHETTLLYVAVTFLALSFSACHERNKPEEEEESNLSKYEATVEVHADIVQGNEYAQGPKRVHLGPDNATGKAGDITEIRWTAGDEVACWNYANQIWAPYQLISGADSVRANFRGKAVHTVDDHDNQLAIKIDYAIFPLSATYHTFKADGSYNLLAFPSDQANKIYFKTPGVQTYVAPRPGKGSEGDNPTFDTQCNVMTGWGDGSGNTYFRSTGGVLLLKLKGSATVSRIYKMKLKSNKDEKLWGTFEAAIDVEGKSTVTVTQETTINGQAVTPGTNELELDCSSYYGANRKLPDQFVNFYFVVPYGVFSSGFTVYLDVDGTGYKADANKITTIKDNTIKQSEIKVMPKLEFTDNVTLTWSLDDLYEQGTVTEL